MKKIKLGVFGRLHINSLDMNGKHGRCCGGLGLCLRKPETILVVEKAKQNKIVTLYPKKVKKILDKICFHYKIKDKFNIYTLEEIKEHIGLGSETQLNLALAEAILKLCGKEIDYNKICNILSIAKFSGIGLWAFQNGGLVIDGGYDKKNSPSVISQNLPSLLVNIKFPANWKIIVITPKNVRSLSLIEEHKFFKKHTPVPMSHVHKILYHTFLGVINSIKENNFSNFIKSLNIITKLGTKKHELNINKKFTQPILSKLNKMYGFGALSSLGPTCYSFDDKNKYSLKQLYNQFPDAQIAITQANNLGRKIYENI